jgi:hypothetical protein
MMSQKHLALMRDAIIALAVAMIMVGAWELITWIPPIVESP